MSDQPSDKSHSHSHSVSSTTTRQSTAAPPSGSTSQPKPPLSANPTAIIADKATLIGTHPITVGSRAIIHPYAKLDSTSGPIDIADGCIIWERAEIGTPQSSTASLDTTDAQSEAGGAGVSLGASVIVSATAKVGCGASVGAHTTLDVGAKVGAQCSIGEWCKFAALTSVEPGTTLPDFSVVFFAAEEQTTRVNVSARDFEKVRALEIRGRENERENLVKTLGIAKTAVTGKAR